MESLNGVMEEMKKVVIDYGSANHAVAVLKAGTFNEVRMRVISSACPVNVLAALLRVFAEVPVAERGPAAGLEQASLRPSLSGQGDRGNCCEAMQQ